MPIHGFPRLFGSLAALAVLATVSLHCGGSSGSPDPSGSWSQPELIAVPLAGWGTATIPLAVDPRGAVLASWIEVPGSPGQNRDRLRCRLYQPEAGWSATQEVACPEDDVSAWSPLQPCTAVFAGPGAGAWLVSRASRVDLNGSYMFVDTCLAGQILADGTTLPATPIAPVDRYVDDATAAGDGQGTLFAAWSEGQPGGGPGRLGPGPDPCRGLGRADPAADRDGRPGPQPGGRGDPPRQRPGALVPDPRHRPGRPLHRHPGLRVPGRQRMVGAPGTPGPDGRMPGPSHLGPGSAGEAAAVWYRVPPSRDRFDLMAARFTPAGGWGAAEVVATTRGQISESPRAAFTGPGQLAVAFLANDDPNGHGFPVRVCLGSAGQWSPAQVLSPGADNSGLGVLASDHGHLLLSWQERDDLSGYTRVVTARASRDTGGWDAPQVVQTVGPDGGMAYNLSMAMAGDDRIHAFWCFLDGRGLCGWTSVFTPVAGW